jgi:hypothetical protein
MSGSDVSLVRSDSGSDSSYGSDDVEREDYRDPAGMFPLNANNQGSQSPRSSMSSEDTQSVDEWVPENRKDWVLKKHKEIQEHIVTSGIDAIRSIF